MKSFGRRLAPGADLRAGIEEMVRHYGIAAGAVQSASGYLARVEISVDSKLYSGEGRFKVHSVEGSTAPDNLHLNLTIETPDGFKIAGLLVDGCKVDDAVDVVLVSV